LTRIDLETTSAVELIRPEYYVPGQFVHTAQQSSDGALYYLYANSEQLPDTFFEPSFRMYRSEQDGVTHRMLLRNDSYNISQVLWARDLSLAVIVSDGGKIIVLTTDNKPALTLPQTGYDLRWSKD
jgi:hypothetical protein